MHPLALYKSKSFGHPKPFTSSPSVVPPYLHLSSSIYTFTLQCGSLSQPLFSALLPSHKLLIMPL